MPVSPHPVTFTIYNIDNTTLKSGALVYCRNVTKRTQTSLSANTTNASGVAIVDLANLPLADGQTLEYETGDEILLIAYNGNDHDAVKYTVTGSSKSQTLYLNPARHNPELEKETLSAVIAANTESTNYYAKVYNQRDGRLLLQLECLANSTVPAFLDGLKCSGGIVIEREHQGLVVTVVIK